MNFVPELHAYWPKSRENNYVGVSGGKIVDPKDSDINWEFDGN